MTDVPDGSSGAAQGAQDTEESTDAPQRSLWDRLFGGKAEDEDDDPPSIANGTPVPPKAPPRPGLSNLRSLKVVDVAIPTVEIVAVPETISREGLVEVFRDSGNSRLPVYRETLDHPIGMVHLKDFALKYGFHCESDDFDLAGLLRPLIYAPPSMPLSVLMQKMQSERIHMALVIDEYGGVDGLLTIEDLIEQVVGEIEDEHDTEEDELWVKEDARTYLALARAMRDEFESEIGMRLVDEADEEEIDTLGGVVFFLAGRVPTRGEVVPHPSGLEFEIVDADPRRVKRMRVRLPEPAET